MNELMKKQILADYKEVLSSEAGRRVLGGIFYDAHLNRTIRGFVASDTNSMAYEHGRRDLAMDIANTLREVNPFGVATCEVAYQDFLKTYERSDRNGENAGDEYGD